MSSLRFFSYHDHTKEISKEEWFEEQAELTADILTLFHVETAGYRFTIKWFGVVDMEQPRRRPRWRKYRVNIVRLDGTEAYEKYFDDFDEAKGYILTQKWIVRWADFLGEEHARKHLLERLARAMQQVIDRKEEHGEGVGQEPAGGARRQAARVPKGWTEDLH